MQAQNNIKYLLIGNADTVKIIAEFIVVKNPTTQNEAKQIFEKLSKVPERRIDERNKIQGAQGNYYFTMTPPNLFFLCLVEANYPERKVFEMIENINKEHIPLMVTDKAELSASGRQMLKAIVDKFQDPKDKIGDIQNDVNEIQLEMKDNIRKIMVNVDDAKKLQDTSDRIKMNSADYRKNADELQKVTWCQNFKLTLIIVGVVVGLILIIGLPLILR